MNRPGLPPASGRLIYSLARERTYHFVTIVLLVLGLVVTWLTSLLNAESVREEFGPSVPVWLVTAILLVVGWAGFVAWLWWMRRYVRRLTWLPQERVLVVERFGWLVSPRRLPISALRGAVAHAGELDLPGAPSVRAPYRRLRFVGLPPLILDDQGRIHDAYALESILEGREPTRPK